MLKHLVSAALFMGGCLTCLMRAAPTLPSSTAPVHLEPPLSLIPPSGTFTYLGLSHTKAHAPSNDWWHFRLKTFDAKSKTKSQEEKPLDSGQTEEPESTADEDQETQQVGVTLVPATENQELWLMDDDPSTNSENLSIPTGQTTGDLNPEDKGQSEKTTRPVELTIPMKYLARAPGEDQEEFVYTDAPVWKDTRYHFQHQSRQPTLRIESTPIKEYYPDEEKACTVCRGKSTIIGTDIVTGYIKPYIYNKPYGKRQLYNKFRDANSTSSIGETLLFCHSPKYQPVQTFLECVTMRHMMMESLIPKYPYHQVQPGPP